MSGSDDGRGNSEDRENGRAQVDRLHVLARWDDMQIVVCRECGATQVDGCEHGATIFAANWTTIRYVRADAERGAVKALELIASRYDWDASACPKIAHAALVEMGLRPSTAGGQSEVAPAGAVGALEAIVDAGRTSQDIDGWVYARKLRDIASDALVNLKRGQS